MRLAVELYDRTAGAIRLRSSPATAATSPGRYRSGTWMTPTEPKMPGLKAATATGVRQLLEDPISSPSGNDAVAGKSALGGVQPKIVLVKTEQGWAQALGGYPTTHILKPQLGGDSSTVIFDEEFGSRIARRGARGLRHGNRSIRRPACARD